MEFRCVELDQAVIDDILSLGPLLTPRFLERQVTRFVDSSAAILESLCRQAEVKDFDGFFSELHKFAGFAATLGSKQVQIHCQAMSSSSNLILKEDLEKLALLVSKARSEMLLLLQESRKFYAEP
ncbi:MAG: Hpt domain-containing protein [Pseudomonadota bacterium]